MAQNPELEARLIADPTDDEAYLVYADFLQSHGDPRGELITLQHAGRADEARAHLDAHAESLLGPLSAFLETQDGLEAEAFVWRNGFIERARFGYDGYAVEDAEKSADKGLAALLAHPSGALLRELTITINMLDDGGYFGPVMAVLAEHGAPALRHLRVGEFVHAGPGGADDGYEYEMSWTSLGDASAVWRKLPRLERLVLQVGLGGTSAEQTEDVIGELDLPLLRHLEVISGGVSQANLRALAGASLPLLERMDLWLGSGDYGFSGSVEDLAPIFDGSRLPALTHLGLMNAELTDEIVARLARSKILPRLRTLDLRYGTLSDDGARVIAENSAAFAHLESLALDENALSDDGVALARSACPHATAEEQKGEEDRYVSLAE